MSVPVVEIENLVKRYQELVALDHFNLTIEEGEIFGLLGPNGSGKTTTINCILALLAFDKGTVRVFGREMRPDSYDLKRQIGVVMQNVAVFQELTVYENIDYFCGLYVRDKALRRQYVEEAIDFVGLNDFRKFYPKKLSGGLLRRLNIACGIAHKPKLIILDFYNLDMIIALLDFAERQAEKEQPMTMNDWANYLDRILTSTGKQLLLDGGLVSHQEAMDHAATEYRKYKQRTLSDVEQDYLNAIKAISDKSKKGGKK